MKKGLSVLMSAMVVAVLSAAAYAQGGGTTGIRKASKPAVEYLFDAPRGWKRTEDQNGYMLVSPAGSVVVLVKPHFENNMADAVRTTEIDSSYKVVGEVQTLRNGGKTFRVTKPTQNGGTGVVDVFVLMAPGGSGGVLVMALSGPANSASAFESGLAVVESVSFGGQRPAMTAPITESPGLASTSGSEWGSKLSGKHLLFMFSGNGYFEEKHIHLCSAGTFIQTTGSGGYTPGNSDGGSFGARGGRRGSWALSGSTLVLQFQDGAVVQYNVTRRQAGNEVGLNGKRFFIDGNAGC